MFDRSIEEPLVRLPHCALVRNTPSSRSSQVRTHFSLMKRCTTPLCSKLHIMFQDISARMQHSDMSGQSGFIARTVRSTQNKRDRNKTKTNGKKQQEPSALRELHSTMYNWKKSNTSRTLLQNFKKISQHVTLHNLTTLKKTTNLQTTSNSQAR